MESTLSGAAYRSGLAVIHHGFKEQIFGSNEQVAGRGQATKEAVKSGGSRLHFELVDYSRTR